MVSTYRVGPYPALEGAKRALTAVSVVILIVTVALADQRAGIVMAVLCSWLPVAILLHFLNFNRLTKHERLELDETGIRHLRRDLALMEIKWDEVKGFFYDDETRGGPWGFLLTTESQILVLREEFEPFDDLLLEISRYTGLPVPERSTAPPVQPVSQEDEPEHAGPDADPPNMP